MKVLPFLLFSLFLFAAACGTESETPDPGDDTTSGETTGGDDTTGDDTGGDTGGDTTGDDTDEDPGDPAEEEFGRLHGTITRSVAPKAGGIGHIYLAVFDRDPVIDAANAQLIANVIVEDADLSAEDAEIAYEIVDIPPRADKYFVSAFLDDNGTVDMSSSDAAGPDMGDLVSLEGFASPSVSVEAPGDIEFDIDLNIAMPF